MPRLPVLASSLHSDMRFGEGEGGGVGLRREKDEACTDPSISLTFPVMTRR